MTRTYSELSQLETFDERFQYLRLDGLVGEITFGFDRWMNQRFYKSREWLSAKEFVIVRDNGCDLGIPGTEIYHGLCIHHMNPISPEDIAHARQWIIDPEYLITTSLRTHNAIHYGNENLLQKGPTIRRSGDTNLW